MDLTVVRELPDETWRHFLENHPSSNVYHTPEMFRVFSRTKGYEPQLWAAIDRAGEVQALFLPVWVTVKGGPMRYLTTRALVYGSALTAPSANGNGHEALARVINAYRQYAARHAVIFTEVRHVADPAPIRPALDRNGFQHEEHLNYLVNLDRSPDELWNSLLKPARKAVERSKNRGVGVEEARDPSCVPELYTLLEKTYAHAQVPFADISLFKAVFDILVPAGLIRISMARQEGPYVAVSMELTYNGLIHRWYNGWDQQYHALYPNDQLTWDIMEWGTKNGYRCFDFGGAGVPGKPYGPRDFKAKYNGDLVNYGRDTLVHRPLVLKVSTLGYQLYRKTL